MVVLLLLLLLVVVVVVCPAQPAANLDLIQPILAYGDGAPEFTIFNGEWKLSAESLAPAPSSPTVPLRVRMRRLLPG